MKMIIKITYLDWKKQTRKEQSFILLKKIPNDVNTFFVCLFVICVCMCFLYLLNFFLFANIILNTKPQIYHHQHLIRSSNDQDVFIYEADAHTKTFNI